MIVTFSGPDGVGKSTHLMSLSCLFRQKGIDHDILYVRGLATPLTCLYRKWFGRWGKEQSVRDWILRIGLDLTTIEMMYLWGVKLRWMEKKHRVILCDRYIWDTEADFTARFQNWNPRSFLWKLLKKTIPKPGVSILFTAPTEQIAQQLCQKKEQPLIHEIQIQQDLYSTMASEFRFVVDTSASKDEIYGEILRGLEKKR